jgi:ectoine hydroxylase-related dioxygenase (phytanoyl-CoA dioxygenase family)
VRGIDRLFAEPTAQLTHQRDGRFCGERLFERERIFRDLLVREPLVSLAEAIVDPTCHLVANGVVYNRPGEAISDWHTDDGVYFPLSPEISRFDPRMTMPNFIVSFQLPLTDVSSAEYGPTQIVPRSHYSGREPDTQENPTFEDRGPISIFCKAGDLCLQHPQTWHRGGPNTSGSRRCLLQIAYGDRRIAPRFYPFLNYRVPDHVLEDADDRLLRQFGKHPKGSYG